MDLIAEIGFTAGDIYSSGIEKPKSISDIKKKTKKDDALLYMGIGWLAREGKIKLTRKGKTILVKK